MDRSILAKLHDILKLTGDSKIHYCPEYCDGLSSINSDIKKALKHHCVSRYWTSAHKSGCNPFPLDKEMLCIHLADVKAATISRKLRTSKYRSYKTFRIWRDIIKDNNILKQEKDALSQYPGVIEEVKKSTNLEELYKRFEQDFLIRSEDAGHCPFASLHTHNELTALWYTFFLGNCSYLGIQEKMDESKEYRKVVNSFAKKKVAMVRLKLTTHGKLSRLRDTKLIQDVTTILKEIAGKIKGIIIYELAEEILVITIPDDVKDIKGKVEDVLRLRTNYYFESTIVETLLSNKEFLHIYNSLFGPYQQNLYPKLDTEIIPREDNEASHRAIICDMCQMAPASKVYPRERYPDVMGIEPVEEFLCDGCLMVREEADKAKTLAKWEDEEDVSVAFFKITLNMGELVSLLKNMFKKEFDFKDVLDGDLGFSIIKEFLYDYDKFLDSFRERVFSYKDYNGENNHESILPNMFCIKIKNDSEIKPLLNEYTKLFKYQDYFPKFVSFTEKEKAILPIRLSVTISNVKYPFMEHWQVLNNPKEAINVYAVPHTKLEISFGKYICLRDAGIEDKKISTALHKLAEIEEKTKNQFLVKVTMFDMKNELGGLAKHLITTGELSIQETLAYYKIMRD
ncbi:MAG: hypothetical protein FJ264_00170 [Planctomycetes bacterium]|nr:hypothetical protein [Planctomycetota bacterium]